MFKIAFRNILRNGRRSVMMLFAIAVGSIALVLFGQLNRSAYLVSCWMK